MHHDTHDVLCLQVEGEKRWLVYAPLLELPLKHQKYTAEMGDPGEPLMDVTMRAGDTLYLPRGWLHQAMTSDEPSLHLTVGVNVAPWRDAVREALEEVSDEDVRFRRGIGTEAVAPEGLLEALAERLRPELVAGRRRRAFVESRRGIREDLFDQLRALEELDVDTPLTRRPTVIADLDVGEGEAALAYEGRTLRFPARIAPEVEFMLDADDEFTAADLPGRLDDESRLVLVRRLVREGFLQITLD